MESHALLHPSDGESENPVLFQRTARVLVAPVGLAIGLASALALFLNAPRIGHTDAFLGQNELGTEPAKHIIDPKWVDETVSLSEVFRPPDECKTLPAYQFEEVEHSNLGKKGPHKGPEGYVIKARDLVGAGNIERLGRTVWVVINSTGNRYIPASAKDNKMNGRFASVTLIKNDELAFKMSFYDSKWRKLTMPSVAITFFDLDSSKGYTMVEALEIGGFAEKYVAQDSQLKITTLPNGRTRFKAAEEGTGKDNPKNFMHLSTLQRKRSITLMYKNVSEFSGRLVTGDGIGRGYRQFDFVLMPTVKCARIERVPHDALDKFPPLPLDDLLYRPPMQTVAFEDGYPQYFNAWLKKKYDKVREGDVIATVKVGDEIREVKSKSNGTVKETRPLKPGDRVDFKLSTMNLAVIQEEILPALKTGFKTVQAGRCKAGQYLAHYKVDAGQIITRGSLIAVTKNVLGENRQEIRAPQGGLISSIQPLKDGQSCQKVEDLNLITIGKFPPIVPRRGEHDCCDGADGKTFKEWKKELGDKVKVGDVVAVVTDGKGHDTELKCKNAFEDGGYITAKQPLSPGQKLDEKTLGGGPIVAIGQKNRELDQIHPEVGVRCGAGIFKKWLVEVGDEVRFEQKIIDMDPTPIEAPADGFVALRQEGLQPGQKVSDVAWGESCLMLSPSLRTVRPRASEEPVDAVVLPADKTLKKWTIKVGDKVLTGDTLAVMSRKDGTTEAVTATRNGVVTQMSGIKPGDKMKKACNTEYTDTCILATIGESVAPLPVRYSGSAVTVPNWGKSNLRFVEYTVEQNQHVQDGETIAVMEDSDGNNVTADAPHAGDVQKRLEAMQYDMYLDKVLQTDAIATIGLLPSLDPTPDPGESFAVSPHRRNETFETYTVDVNDKVQKGDTIATVSYKKNVTSDEVVDTECIVKEMLVEEGEQVTEGQVLARVQKLKDRIAEASPVRESEVVNQLVRLHDEVKVGDPLLTVETLPSHDQEKVVSPMDGVVTKLAEVGTIVGRDDDPLAAVVESGESGQTDGNVIDITADKNGRVHVLVEEGDSVDPYQPIVQVTGIKTFHKNVTSAMTGTVVERQEDLTNGTPIEQQLSDTAIVKIGVSQKLEAGPFEAAVDAPEGAIFQAWCVKKGDYVKKGDSIAGISVPVVTERHVRRLDGRRLAVVDQEIPAPKNGYVKQMGHLVPGQKISDQQIGPTIATIDIGPPWWLTLLGFLLALCCMMCCLFKIMQKQPPPSIIEEDGPLKPLRKRFEDGQRGGVKLVFQYPDPNVEGRFQEPKHIVWAQFKPLGFKHDNKAPIVAIANVPHKHFTINSYCKDALGVKLGMHLVEIDGDDVTALQGEEDWGTLETKVSEKMRHLPQWPLEVEFRKELDGPPFVVTFVKKTIGIEFKQKAPVQIEKVDEDSPAKAKGISNGWYITKIGDQDVLKNHNYKQVVEMLREGLQPLD